MLDVGKLVRSSYRNLDPTTLLLKPVDVLMGVSQAAKDELKDQNIVTVLDLATSSLFREATLLVAAADDPNSEWALAGRAPRTLVDNAIAELPIEVVADREIQDLRSFSKNVAGRVSTTLGVSTIRDLAAWPPYLAARQIFQQLIGRPDPEAVWDSGTPPELVPTMGRHPNERAYYQTILLDRFIDPPTSENTLIKKSALLAKERLFADAGWKPWQHTAAVALEAAGQVDIASPLLNSPGFDRVAIGALVQFSQSWYTSGLSLGQLLHSLALAPGESTRIAMIDWQRRERGSRAEDTQETDQLTSELVRNRALNEVVDAVAREVQTGSSASQASGESWGFGKSGGGGGSIGGGEGQSYGFGGGYSLGYGTGKSQASSWGVSTGDRNLRAELTQNIQDLTQQASTMARNRWATVVQEVSQQEHEQLSTRAVTNYNHMHALTVQYYEVVQIYRVAIEIDRITRCLFVPMKVLDFRRFEVLTRFRSIIADGALNAQVRATLLSAANSVVLIPARRSQPWSQGNLDNLKSLFGKTVGFPDSSEITFPRNLQPWGLMLGIVGDNTNTQEFAFDSVVIEFEGAPPQTLPISLLGPTESGDLGRKYVDFRPIFGTGEGAKDFWNIRTISLKRKAGKEAYAGEIFVTAAIYPYGTTGGATQGKGTLPLLFQVQANEMLVPVYTIMRTTTDAALAQHLEENALYYSQLIWRSLDPTELSLALAAYTIGGQPLMQVIDPTPVRIAGNYMIFRTYATDDSWQQFLDSKKLSIGPVSSTIVPLPSGGVFAEAVLGRANSAEKLDMTRFWNWQDSPIPIVAPDIAALQAASRNQPVNLDTGKLSPSVLNIMNPTQLPDPTGMTTALTALAQGTMFRDMSGLAATIGLAGTGLTEAFKGSADAQKYAMENFKTAASLISKSGGSKASTASEDGAKINQGKDMDKRGVNSGSNTSTPQMPTQGTSTLGPQASNEKAAYNSALGGSAPTASSANFTLTSVPVIKGRKFQYVEGIDVSQFQSGVAGKVRTVNWNLVKSSGIDFAFIRASYGTTKGDPWFEYNWEAAGAEGIIRGPYHFFRPSQDAQTQAELFVKSVGILRPGDLPPVLDLEWDDNHPDRLRGGLNVDEYIAAAKIWIDTVYEYFGKRAVIYTTAQFWRDATGNSDVFRTHPLWVANFVGGQEPRDLPSPWIDWEFWQFTDKGRVPGIEGDVDRNRFNGTLEDLARLAGFTILQPQTAKSSQI